MLQRFETGPRMSEVVVAGGLCFLSGQVAEDTSLDIRGQTEQTLAEIDRLLALAATDKTKIVRAEIYLADIKDFEGMNEAWDAWVVQGFTPSRLTAEAKLACPDWKVEIVVTAAV